MRFWWWLTDARSEAVSDDFKEGLRRDLGGVRRLSYILVAGLVFFIVWASWAEIDEITRAPGSVVSSSRTQVIQSLEGGAISAIRVKEGDQVDAGQTLVELDDTNAKTTYLQARVKLAGLSAAASRLKAEIFDGYPQFGPIAREYPEFINNQLQLFQKRRAALSEEIKALQGVLGLVREELGMLEPLLKTGDVSRTEVLRLQRQEADLSAQITNKKNRYLQEAQSDLSKVEEDMAGVEQMLLQKESQLQRMTLKAPMKGLVKNIRITTLGGVLRPGEEMMQIVPLDDDLVIEARLKPADLSFVKPGMVANIKLDSYDSAIYGSLTGEITYISPDTLDDQLRPGEKPYYRIRAKTTEKTFSAKPDEKVEIQVGMTAILEIKTGSKSILQFFIKPVTKTLDNAFTER
jgi:adhesin transport system membrane fusion protein